MSLCEKLEKAPIGAFHYKFLGVGCLAWAFNAISVLIVTYALPSILTEWNLPLPIGGVLATSHYVGMLIGASACGLVADRIGRKPTVQLTIGIYAIATGLCAFAWDIGSLTAFRLIGGIGTGGMLPVLSTWLSEYIPTKRRGTFVAILESSWSFGALFISALSWLLIPVYGWRAVFPVVFVAIAFIFLVEKFAPESIRYLEEAGKTKEATEVLEKIGFEAPSPAELEALARRPKVKGRLAELFSQALRRRTIMLWVLWFCIAYAYHGIFVWLPTIVFAEGFPIVKALWYTMLITALQIPGYLSAAFLVEPVGRKPVLAVYLAIAGLASYFFGTTGTDLGILAWGGAISFFNLGAWAVTYAYTPELYPTRVRGTGAGWAGALGRVAGIIAPTLTALIVSSLGTFQTFLGFFAVQMIAAVVVAILGIETKGKTLEEISKC